MEVLVVGAGVAGLIAAICLARDGNDVMVVERAADLSAQGYMLDFFGPGYDVAERLGLIHAFERIHCPVDELVFVDESGRRRASLSYPRLRRTLFHGRHFNFLRGDLVATLCASLPERVELRYERCVEALFLEGARMTVEWTGGERRKFDLVLGADGARSTVRALAFSGQAREVPLGAHAAAYVVEGVLGGSSMNLD